MHEELARMSELIQPARSIAVLVGRGVSVDQMAAALALARSLRAVGKEANIYTPELPSLPTVFADLTELKTEFGKQNLIISFDYHESSVDKVSYAISQDNNKFFLTIRPKKGNPPLDPATVEFSYAGTDCDLLVLIGEHDLSNLQQLYFGYEDVYASVPIISFNSFQSKVGAIAFDVSSHSSYSEYMTLVLGGMQFEFDADSATDLYAGLALETKAFTSAKTTAETFEVAAELLRRGARRSHELQILLTPPVAQKPNNQETVAKQESAAAKSAEIIALSPSRQKTHPKHQGKGFNPAGLPRKK